MATQREVGSVRFFNWFHSAKPCDAFEDTEYAFANLDFNPRLVQDVLNLTSRSGRSIFCPPSILWDDGGEVWL